VFVATSDCVVHTRNGWLRQFRGARAQGDIKGEPLAGSVWVLGAANLYDENGSLTFT
jgi:hypothetical protein